MDSLFITPTWDKVFQYVKYNRLHHLCLGSGDSGKTNMWLYFLKYLPSEFRVIVINSMGHLAYKDYCDVTIDEKSIPTLYKGFDKIKNGKYAYQKINFIFSDNAKSSLKAMKGHFNNLCRELFYYEDKQYTKFMWKTYRKKINKQFMRQARFIILVDELMDFCDGEKIEDYHLRIIREGRNHGIIHIGNTQRNQGIGKWITTQSKTKYLFELDLYDVFRLSGKIQSIEKVKELYPYHFIVIHGLTRYNQYYYRPVEKLKDD